MDPSAIPRASARVVSPLHLRILGLIAAAEPAYGDISLRLEGGTALAADLEATDPGLTEVQVGQALARGLGRPIVASFPLRLLVAIDEEDVQRTIRLALEECARLVRRRADWDAKP